jgi:hypothetical protein
MSLIAFLNPLPDFLLKGFVAVQACIWVRITYTSVFHPTEPAKTWIKYTTNKNNFGFPLLT